MKIYFAFVIITILTICHVKSQNDKAIALFEDGSFDKCYNYCTKLTDKDPKNQEALFYKALSLYEIAKLPEYESTYKRALEKSLKILLQLKKKDVEDSFFKNNSLKYKEICSYSILASEKYIKANKSNNATLLFNDLIELFSDSTFVVFQANIAICSGNDYSGTFLVDKLLTKLKFGNRNTIISDSLLADGFAKLCLSLNTHGQTDLSYKLFLCTTDFFPSVEPLFISSLNKKDPESQGALFLEKAQHALDSIRETEELQLKVWAETSKKLISQTAAIKQLSESDLEKLEKSVRTSFQLFYYKEKHLDRVNDLFATLIAEKYKKKNKTDCDNLFMLLMNVNREYLPNAEVEKLIIGCLQKLRDNNDFDAIGGILSELNGSYNGDPLLVRLNKEMEERLLEDLKSYKVNDMEKCDLLSQFHPDYELLSQEIVERVATVISEKMASGNYSETALLLHRAMKRYPNNDRILKLQRQFVIKDFEDNYFGSSIPYSEMQRKPGLGECSQGTLPASTYTRALQRLNYLRRTAGLPDQSVFSSKLNECCQAAAHIMNVNGKLSHQPSKDWKCWSQKGYDGANNSNLSLGIGGTSAITSQLEDNGSNNASVGHRCHILNQYNRVFGFGSTDYSMALWVLKNGDMRYADSVVAKYDIEFVAWPPPGYIPDMLVFSRWSLDVYGNFDSKKATVKVDGKPVPIVIESDYLPFVWSFQNRIGSSSRDTKVTITIPNVVFWDESKKPKDIVYEVIIIGGD